MLAHFEFFPRPSSSDREVALRKEVEKLKRQLSNEKLASTELRNAYNRMIADRHELELFLRQCLEDVKTEIATSNSTRKVRPRRISAAIFSLRPSDVGAGRSFPHPL